MSRFSELLSAEKIDPRRILVASNAIERTRAEDRRARFLKRNKKPEATATPAAAGDVAEPPAAKPRSGRTVTRVLLRRAEEGQPLTGAQKTRLLRALNRVLEQKKREPVDLRKAF